MKIKISTSILLTLICTFFVSIPLIAQIDHSKAHRRYWYYRTRMINDFMKVGKNQGECIVFAERNNFISKSKIGPDQIDITNQYIMALALEYKLLSRGSQDTKETIYELFHLLWTINRLDLEAEQYLDVGNHTEISAYDGLLNGFMLREDAPSNFVANNINHFNYGKTIINPDNMGFTGLDYTNNLTLDNKFSGFFAGTQSYDLNLPQDKYHTMLVALMFVVKYIPSGLGYYENNQLQQFQDHVTDIKQEAVEIAKRIYKYLRNNDTWKLKKINSQGQKIGDIVVGESALLYSWALSRMVCHVENGYPFTESINYCDSKGLLHTYAATTGFQTYNLLCASNPSGEDNAVFQAWDEAGSNTDPFTPIQFFNVAKALQTLSTNWNVEWAELLRKILHQDKNLYRQLSVYAGPIGSAPCQGPHNFGGCSDGGYEWSSQDRLEHPSYRGNGCNNNDPIHPGYYPGVDYMLLHNLYYEYMNQITLDNINGNASANSQSGGNTLGSIFASVGNFISNAAQNISTNVSTFINTTLPSIICNNNLLGSGVINCNSTGGLNNAVPYLGYNLMDNYDNSIWPKKLMFFGTGGNPIGNHQYMMLGTVSSPAKISVFQNLTSNANIDAVSPVCGNCSNMTSLQENSSVIYRAGKEITLTTGFSAAAGSNFHAYVARYICYSYSDPLNMRLIGDSTAIDSMDYLADNYMQLPLHVYESPKSDSDLFPYNSDSSGTNSKFLADELKNVQEEIKNNRVLAAKKMILVPNPNNGQFSILTGPGSESEFATIGIYDSKGQMILQYDDVHNKNKIEVDLGDAAKGIYLIKYSSKNGFLETKRVSIQ